MGALHLVQERPRRGRRRDLYPLPRIRAHGRGLDGAIPRHQLRRDQHAGALPLQPRGEPDLELDRALPRHARGLRALALHLPRRPPGQHRHHLLLHLPAHHAAGGARDPLLPAAALHRPARHASGADPGLCGDAAAHCGLGDGGFLQHRAHRAGRGGADRRLQPDPGLLSDHPAQLRALAWWWRRCSASSSRGATSSSR